MTYELVRDSAGEILTFAGADGKPTVAYREVVNTEWVDTSQPTNGRP